jgi:hypothetical protein
VPSGRCPVTLTSVATAVEWLSLVSPAVEWLTKNALPWFAVGYGVYWLRRFRTQELVRSQMQLATEIVKVLFAIDDLVRRWIGGSVSSFSDERNKFLPELVSTLARSRLLLPPIVAERLDLVADHLSQIYGQIMIEQAFRAQRPGLPFTEAQIREIDRVREQARTVLPAKILRETSAVMTELHMVFHLPKLAAKWAAKREAALAVELQQTLPPAEGSMTTRPGG